MADEGIADLLEAPPIDLRARGFRRVKYKAFVREVRNCVRHHDPTKPVVPVPLWPGLADVTRTWRAGTWRDRRSAGITARLH